MDELRDRDYRASRTSFRDELRDESSLADVIDLAARRFLMAMILAGGAIALAIYSRPVPRYEAIVTDTGIIRVDTRAGTVLHCVENGCYTVVRRGQALLDQEERRKARTKAFGQDDAPAQKALPAPQAAPPEPATAQPAQSNGQ